jgi:hypothetical protein
MDNLETMIAEIRMLIVDEVSERLEERMNSSFQPTEDQLTEIAQMIAQEVKDKTLEQVESCIDVELDLSVDHLWDEILDKWEIEEIEEIPDSVWEGSQPLPEISGFHDPEPVKSCPGCCDKPAEKINEIEGIQTHIVDMEW